MCPGAIHTLNTNMGYWRPSIQFLFVLQSAPKLYEKLPSCRILTETSASGSTILLFFKCGLFQWRRSSIFGRLCKRTVRLALGVDFRACITFTFWRNSRSIAPLRVLEAPKSFKGKERPWLPSRLWHFIYVTEKTWKPKTWIAFIIWVTIARSGTFPTWIFSTGVSVSMQNHKRCAEGKQITEIPT